MRGYGKRKSKLLIFLLLLCMLVGCGKADTADENTEAATGEKTENVTEEALAPEKPEGKNDADVEALQKIIEKQNASGANLPVDVNDGAYNWDENGRLTGLRIAKCKLQGELSCEELSALMYLDCRYNQLSSLDVSKNTKLMELYCNDNKISSLDISKNTELTDLGCGDNEIGSLDVSKNTALSYLLCDHNQLSSLDVSKNTALEYLYCDYNQLSGLDVSKNTILLYLYCSHNKLSSLDISKNTELMNLDCEDNEIVQYSQ